jgi:hypothetical protein
MSAAARGFPELLLCGGGIQWVVLGGPTTSAAICLSRAATANAIALAAAVAGGISSHRGCARQAPAGLEPEAAAP